MGLWAAPDLQLEGAALARGRAGARAPSPHRCCARNRSPVAGQGRRADAFATSANEEELIAWARKVSAARIRERGDELNRQDDKEIADAHSARALWWNWDTDKLRLDVQGYLAGDDAQRFVDAVDSLAKELPDTVAAERGSTEPLSETDAETSLDQRRADALVLLATSAGGDKVTKPEIVVHAPLSALAGNEGNCCTSNGDVLHPELVRKLSCDARLRFVLTDEEGNPLGIGHSSRTIPGWLRQQVLRRDGYRCTFPGCEARRFLDVHHIKHWAKGGATDFWNLGIACPGHHPLVHVLDWEMALEGSQVVWYTPLGQRYEPGRPPPDDPDPPPERRPRPADVAGYSRIFDLLKVL